MIEDDQNKLPFCESKMFDVETSTTSVVEPTEEDTHMMGERDTTKENNSNQAARSSFTEVSTKEQLQVISLAEEEEVKQSRFD